jgi:site-specific recombinase XerD
LEEFLTSLRAVGRSDATIDWYSRMIRAYVDWLEATHRNGADLVLPATVEAFLDYERQHVSASTVSARFRALRPFYRWMRKRGYLGDYANPIDGISEPKVGKHQPNQADPDEINTLLASIDRAGWLGLRDYAIILCLAHTGLRVSEVVGLRLCDVDFAERFLTVTGKGDKERIVPFSQALAAALCAYVESCPIFEGNKKRLANDHKALWWGSDGWTGIGGPLKKEGVQQMLKRRCLSAGCKHLNAHSFRHGYAVEMLNRGADISVVADFLGHESIETTKVYLRFRKKHLRSLHDQIWKE